MKLLPQFGALPEQAYAFGSERKLILVEEEDEFGPTGNFIEVFQFFPFQESKEFPPKGIRHHTQLIHTPIISKFGLVYNRPTFITLQHIAKLFRLYLANLGLLSNGHFMVDAHDIGDFVLRGAVHSPFGQFSTDKFSQRYKVTSRIHPDIGSVILKKLLPTQGRHGDKIIKNLVGNLLVEDYQNHIYMSNDTNFYTGKGDGPEGEPLCSSDLTILKIKKAETEFIDECGARVPSGTLFLDIDSKRFIANGMMNQKIDDFHIPGLSLAFGDYKEGDQSTITCAKDIEAVFTGRSKVGTSDGWIFDPNTLLPSTSFIDRHDNKPFEAILPPTETEMIKVKLHPDGFNVSKLLFTGDYKAEQAFYKSGDDNNPLISLEAPTWLTDVFDKYLKRMYNDYKTKFADFPNTVTWVVPITDLFDKTNPSDLIIPRKQKPDKYADHPLITADFIYPDIQDHAFTSPVKCEDDVNFNINDPCFKKVDWKNPPKLSISPTGQSSIEDTGLQTGGTTLVKKGHIFNAYSALETWFGTTIFSEKFLRGMVFDSASTVRKEKFNEEFTSVEDLNFNNVWPVKNYTPNPNQITLNRGFVDGDYTYVFTDGTFVYKAEYRNKELLSIIDVPNQAAQQGETIPSVDTIYSPVNGTFSFIGNGTRAYLLSSYSINGDLPVTASTLGVTNFAFFWDNENNGSISENLKWQSFITNGSDWQIWTSKNDVTTTGPWEEIMKFDLSEIGDSLIGGMAGRVTTLEDHAIFVNKSDKTLRIAQQNRMDVWTQEYDLVNTMDVPTAKRAIQDDENLYFGGPGIYRNKVCLTPMHRYFSPKDSLDITAFTQTHTSSNYLTCNAPNLMRAAVDLQAKKRFFATTSEGLADISGPSENVGEAIMWDNVRFGFNVVDATKDYSKFQEIRGFPTPAWKEIFGKDFKGTIGLKQVLADGTIKIVDKDKLFCKNGCRNNNEYIRDNWRPEPLLACTNQKLESGGKEFTILRHGIQPDRKSGFIIVKPAKDLTIDDLGSEYEIKDYDPKLIPLAIWYKGNTLHVLSNFGNLTKDLYVIRMSVSKAKNGDPSVIDVVRITFPSSHLAFSDLTHIVKDFSLFENEYYIRIISIPDGRLASNSLDDYYKIPEGGGNLAPLPIESTDFKKKIIAYSIIPARIFGQRVYVTNDPGIPNDPFKLDDNPFAILDENFQKHLFSRYFHPPVGNPYQFISEIATPSLSDNRMFRLVKTIDLPLELGTPIAIAEFNDERFNEFFYQITTNDRAYKFSQGERIASTVNRSSFISSTPYVGASVGGALTDLPEFSRANDKALSLSSEGDFREFGFEADSLIPADNGEWWPKQVNWRDLIVIPSGENSCSLVDLKSRSPDGGLLDSTGHVCLSPNVNLSINAGATSNFIRANFKQNIIFDTTGLLKTAISCWFHDFTIPSESLHNVGVTAPGTNGNHYDGRYYWSFDDSEIVAEDLFQKKIRPTVQRLTFKPNVIISGGTGLTNLVAPAREDIHPHAWLKSKGYLGHNYNGPWSILDWKADGSKAVCKMTITGGASLTNLAYMEINDDALYGEPIWIYDSASLASTSEGVLFGRHGSSTERFDFLGSFSVGNRGAFKWVPGSITLLNTEHGLNTGGTACVGGGAPDPLIYNLRDGFAAVRWFQKGTVAPSCCLERYAIFNLSANSKAKEYRQAEGVVGALTCCGTPGITKECPLGSASFTDFCAFDGASPAVFSEYTTVNGIIRPTITKNSDHWLVATRQEFKHVLTACVVSTVHYFIENGSFIDRQDTPIPTGVIYGMDPGIITYDNDFYRFPKTTSLNPGLVPFPGDGTDPTDKYQRKAVGATSTVEFSFYFATAASTKFILNKANIVFFPLELRPSYFTDLE